MAWQDSPLFRSFSRAVKAAARSDFRLSQLGKALKEADRPAAQGKAREHLREIGRKVGSKPNANVGRISGKVDKYARQSQQELIGRALDAMGPLGHLIKAFLRPHGKALTPHVDREIQAATQLLQAFGHEVIPPPPARGGIGPKVEQTQKYLETLGFTVSRPKALPGWQQYVQQQTAPKKTPARPRKTVDLDVGQGRLSRIKLDDPLITGAMIKVTSSNVHSIGFQMSAGSPQLGTLLVRFLQGSVGSKTAGPLYEYANVKTEVFQRFRKAASKGRFVWDNLRIRGTLSGHRYDYKLAGIAGGYVPRKATLTGRGEEFVKRTFLGESTRTGERRLFESRPSVLVRPVAFRGSEPNRGKGFRG